MDKSSNLPMGSSLALGFRCVLGGALLLSATCSWSQTAASLTQSGGIFTLTVPYFEYATGSSKQALGARFNTSTLTAFTLDTGSVASATVISNPVSAASIAAYSGGYRLSVPYFEYGSGSAAKAFAVNLVTADLKTFNVELSTVREVALHSTALAAPTAVTVATSGSQTVGSNTFGSSSKLAVAWAAPTGYVPDHYVVTATEPLMNTSVSSTVAGSATGVTLTQLKATTVYAVVVKACKDSACASSGSASAVSATTSAEYWQLQGSGNTVSTLSKPVSDGNARLSATRFGAEAGMNANTVQFYYGPKGVSGMAMAISGTASSTSSSSYLSSFTSYATTSGLRSPSNPTGIKDIMTGQGVPLSSAMGGKVRLFFESNDTDGKTRIYSVDSVDGYVGRDFNSGSPSTCTTSSDYLATGNCPASVVIGVAGDSVNANTGFTAARQNKVAWPTLTDWRWDGAPGTFMVFTVDRLTGCTTAQHNHAYAVWNGSKFVVQYDAAGCPKVFKAAQAALPMHIGDTRYKMYFGDPTITGGKSTSSTLPFVGPKKLIYADGRSTDNAATVEFEDWENVAAARNVHFLWPSGELLNDTAEGYIDDFHFLTPTGSLDLQVLYLSITDGSVVPFAATAVLLNP
jgi:hypothetical protein